MGGRVSDVTSAQGRQYATLPFRVLRTGEFELLLLTSRETRRWVVPKGWPIRSLSAGESAAREAFEEAGLLGVVLGDGPIGTYQYEKRLPKGVVSRVDVDVFLFQVTRQVKKWPEKAERQVRWCAPAEAASLVHEAELARLMLAVPDHIQRLGQAGIRGLSKAV